MQPTEKLRMLKTVLWLSWPANTDLHQGFSCAGSAREKPIRMVIDSGRGHAPDKANHRSSPSALLRDCALPCLHCSAQPGVPVYDPAFVRHETFLQHVLNTRSTRVLPMAEEQ